MNTISMMDLFKELQQNVSGNTPPSPCYGEADPKFYTDPDWYQAEQDKLFKGKPLIVGHSSMLKKAGDFFVHDHAGESAIIVKGKDGEIRALLNACRHRGVKLIASDNQVSRRPSFVCPYHNWTYDWQGKLTHIPLKDDVFPDLDPSCHGLKQLPIAVCEGLIFVSFGQDQNPLDLDTFLGPLKQEFARFNMADHHFFRQTVSVKNCNWKLIIEAFQDSYHVARLHRKTVGSMFMDSVAALHRSQEHIMALVARKNFPETLELPEHQWNLRKHCSPALYVFPNTEIIIHPDYISYLSLFPISAEQTIVVHGCLIEEEPTTEAAKAHWERAFDIIENGVFQAEDLHICEQTQISLNNGYNEPLMFGSHEKGVIQFHSILKDVMGPYPSIK